MPLLVRDQRFIAMPLPFNSVRSVQCRCFALRRFAIPLLCFVLLFIDAPLTCHSNHAVAFNRYPMPQRFRTLLCLCLSLHPMKRHAVAYIACLRFAFACPRYSVAVTRGSVSDVPLPFKSLRLSALPFLCFSLQGFDSHLRFSQESDIQTVPCLRFSNNRYHADHHSRAIR